MVTLLLKIWWRSTERLRRLGAEKEIRKKTSAEKQKSLHVSIADARLLKANNIWVNHSNGQWMTFQFLPCFYKSSLCKARYTCATINIMLLFICQLHIEQCSASVYQFQVTVNRSDIACVSSKDNTSDYFRTVMQLGSPSEMVLSS